MPELFRFIYSPNILLILVGTIAIFAAYAISYSFNEGISLLAAKMISLISCKEVKLEPVMRMGTDWETSIRESVFTMERNLDLSFQAGMGKVPV